MDELKNFIEELKKFDERLYTLDVAGVQQYNLPKIIDPNRDLNDLESRELVVCYEPDRKQVIQLAFIIWQVATRERNLLQTRDKKFEIAERRCTSTRKALGRLLLPLFDGDQDKAKDFCVTLYREHKSDIDKYIDGWGIVSRPASVWVDKEGKNIFLCQNEGRIVVGLSPENYVFVYNPKN